MNSIQPREAESKHAPRRAARQPRVRYLAPVPPESLERRLAFDLVGVLTSEVPDVDPIAVGLGIVEEARRREAQGRREWGDREKAS